MSFLIIFRLLLFIVFLLIIDILTYYSLGSFVKEWKNRKKKRFIKKLPWIVSALFLVFAAIYLISVRNISLDYIKSRHFFNIFDVLFIILFLKMTMILFKVKDKIFFFFIFIICKFVFRKKTFDFKLIGRKVSNFFFIIGTITALLFLLLLSYGMKWGKYDFEIEKHEISFKNLPKSFDGLKIVQISDTHLGSFPDTSYLTKAINLINAQNADIIFFTGDLVNNQAIEANDYISMFKCLKAKYGKYAILGNHDMGDYRRWYTEADKLNNYFDIVKANQLMGFKMLLDTACYLKINNDSIAIVGVRNWSLPPFKKYGNLKRAMNGVPNSIFKILLSHNPSHWDREVQGKTNIDLTLSGHTHGMQIGFYNKYFRWSPIQYMYPHWGGLYKEGEQYLYVNKGLGFLGLPIRLGIKPEITVIVLKSL